MPAAAVATAFFRWASKSDHSRAVEGASLPWSISCQATSKTLAMFTFTKSFMVYSRPGSDIQLQPTAMRWRASWAE